jgi:RNA polymerase sigma factor (sigma-70 family)
MRTSPINRVIDHLRRAVLLPDGVGLGDGELLSRFIERHDETALAALVGRHGPMVWGVCRRQLSHHDAADAFQATFLVLVRKAASIRSREMVGNWLYGVAHQTALLARRTAARRRAREVQVTGMPDIEAVQPDQCPDLRPLLDDELSHLPESYRAVIVLCELEGRSRKEAACQLGVPEGTVAGRLARARVMLAKRLIQRGVTLSGGALAAILSQNIASAGVPASVVSKTIKVASLTAAGQATTGVISAQVVALTEGVLKSMLLTKLKTAFVLAVVVGLLGWGSGVFFWQTQAKAQRQEAAEKSAPAVQQTDQLTKTLLALDKQLWDAAKSGDWTAYDRLLAKDFVGHSAVSGRSDKQGTVENVKNRRYSEWTIRDVETREISKDVAILTYVYSCKVNSVADGTVEKYQDRRTSLVWTKRDGAWVLVFCQETADAKATEKAESRKPGRKPGSSNMEDGLPAKAADPK